MNRFRISSSILALLMVASLSAPSFVAAQSSGATTKADVKTAAKTDTKAVNTNAWTTPRTPDGQPDLQGYWTTATFTPMERPTKYGNREFLTEKETQDVFDDGVRRSFSCGLGNDDCGKHTGENVQDDAIPRQDGVRPNNRTSLVVDPPDGRIPPLTPEAKARRARGAAEGENSEASAHFNIPTDLGVRTTCVTINGGPPIAIGGFNSGLSIVQNANTVVIEAEFGNEVRIIPLDGRPHAGANIQQFHGDGRGHWEGDTLVVETTNFRPEGVFRGANPKTLNITERFKRVAADKIEYSFTINDPSTWTKPWTAIVPLNSIQGPIWEYDCSENNFDAVNVLAGARADEKAAEEKTKANKEVPISQK